jgi:hypothetical protein
MDGDVNSGLNRPSASRSAHAVRGRDIAQQLPDLTPKRDWQLVVLALPPRGYIVALWCRDYEASVEENDTVFHNSGKIVALSGPTPPRSSAV